MIARNRSLCSESTLLYGRTKRSDLVGCCAPDLVRVGNDSRGVLWCNTAKEQEDEQHTAADDDELPRSRAGLAKLVPVAASLTGVTLENIGAQLVVDHAGEGDTVAKELQTANLGTPDNHGGNDEEDVLEDTAERKHQGRGLADLYQACQWGVRLRIPTRRDLRA